MSSFSDPKCEPSQCLFYVLLLLLLLFADVMKSAVADAAAHAADL